MPDYDLAIRGGTITTASDTFRADLAVHRGRIVAIAARVEGAAREIDATGLIVMPGGSTATCISHSRRSAGPKWRMISSRAPGQRLPAETPPCCRSRFNPVVPVYVAA